MWQSNGRKTMSERIAFIGGGNMASAIIGGLIKQGFASDHIEVIEPSGEAQRLLKEQFSITAQDRPGAFLGGVDLVVWAVKPQVFKEVALLARFHTKTSLHLSVAAGIPSASIARWLDSDRVVRSMPNTPALIGLGITGLFARPGASAEDRRWVQRVVSTVGQFLWFDEEDELDAVTALSGSGPAYVFYFMESMIAAGTEMGLSREKARKLALETFRGASALACGAIEPPEILRQRVTSKGGTTHAAIQAMEDSHMKDLFSRAIFAAQQRARQLGEEFGDN
jgi:pyrroline-5-carboxylate reductase